MPAVSDVSLHIISRGKDIKNKKALFNVWVKGLFVSVKYLFNYPNYIITVLEFQEK